MNKLKNDNFFALRASKFIYPLYTKKILYNKELDRLKSLTAQSAKSELSRLIFLYILFITFYLPLSTLYFLKLQRLNKGYFHNPITKNHHNKSQGNPQRI